MWACVEPAPLLWDGRCPAEAARCARVREIVGRAAAVALPSDEAAELAALLAPALGGEPSRVVAARAHLAPAALPLLVDANPAVAVLALRALATVAPPRALARCWAALALGDVTLHSMEVVSVLAGGGVQTLPPSAATTPQSAAGAGAGAGGARAALLVPPPPSAAAPRSPTTTTSGDDAVAPAPPALQIPPPPRRTAAAPAAAAVLPADCVALFISRCVSACDAAAAADNAFAQNRLARLVAVFLTALIRNRVIVAGDLLLAEVAAFATRFSRVRESAALFKAVKALESAGGGGGGD